MSRPQFTLRTLLVLMLVVGAFLAGYVWGRGGIRNRGLYRLLTDPAGERYLVPVE
jgi:hypothetical protein